MTVGRKKKCRNIEINFDKFICNCFGPLKATKSQLEKLEKVYIMPDELQTLVYQDQQGNTMEEGSQKLGVSKTVYAGIYQSAKTKIIDCIINNKILMLECPQK